MGELPEQPSASATAILEALPDRLDPAKQGATAYLPPQGFTVQGIRCVHLSVSGTIGLAGMGQGSCIHLLVAGEIHTLQLVQAI